MCIVESFNIGSACEWRGWCVGRQQGLGVAGGWLLGGKRFFAQLPKKTPTVTAHKDILSHTWACGSIRYIFTLFMHTHSSAHPPTHTHIGAFEKCVLFKNGSSSSDQGVLGGGGHWVEGVDWKAWVLGAFSRQSLVLDILRWQLQYLP